MTSHDASLLDKMMESAGELLFSASAHEDPFARDVLKKLAHQLGRLYGETIRACRGHDGLQEEVQTTFMSGMAIEPNFGREEVLRDSGAEAQEEKTAGQLLFEKEAAAIEGYEVTWDMLCMRDREHYEAIASKKAKSPDIEAKTGTDGLTHWHVKTSAPAGTKAMSALDTALREGTLGEEKSPGQLLYEKELPERRSLYPSWDQLPPSSHKKYEAKARENAAMDEALGEAVNGVVTTLAKSCWKCKGTKDMGFTTRVPCDAC